MSESRPKGGEASRRPPEPHQLGTIRDFIKELTPSLEEVEKGKKAGRALPNSRSHGFAAQDGMFFHVLVTSHELIPRANNPETFGFINVMKYDSSERNILLSQSHFHLDAEGDAEDEENLRFRPGTELGADGANAEQAQELIDMLTLARDIGTIIE